MEEKPRYALRSDARLLALIAIAVVVMLVLFLEERDALATNLRTIETSERNLREAKDLLAQHHEIFFPVVEKPTNIDLFRGKSLRTVIKECTEKAGITSNLVAVNPGEDRKNRLLKAKLSLRNITLRQAVEFIVALKNLSAGIRDSDATLRMNGYNVDRWSLDLELEAPMPPEQREDEE